MIMAHLRFLECSLIFSLIILRDGSPEEKGTFREPGECCKPSSSLKEQHVKMTEIAFKPTSSVNFSSNVFLVEIPSAGSILFISLVAWTLVMLEAQLQYHLLDVPSRSPQEEFTHACSVLLVFS